MGKRLAQWLKRFMLVMGAAGALSAQAQSCVPGTWVAPPNTLWDSVNGSFAVQAESARFQIRSSGPGLLTQQQAQTALTGMEALLDWFTGPTVKWPEPFCDSAVKYKVQIFTSENYGLSGAGAGDRAPAIWVGPGALIAIGAGQVSGMVHEFTHAMQFHSRGMRDTQLGGWMWESHAEFMAHQYPGNPDKTGCSSLSAWMPHLYYGSTRARYCNWQFWDHLKNKYGFAAVSDIFLKTAGQTGQDPLAVLMRNQGWSAALLGDEFGQYAMRNVSWDYIDGQDGFNRGAAYRASYGPITDLGQVPDYSVAKRLRVARLEAIDVASRRFVVSKFFAPQRFGYNIVKLVPDGGASRVSVNFRGVVQSAIAAGAELGTGAYQPGAAPDWTAHVMPTNPASNWRWGVVAIDQNNNPRYSPMQRGATGSLDFALQAGDLGVYLVVAATPDAYHGIFWDQTYHTLYRYPYKVELAGAMPDGFQAGYQPNIANGFPPGARHPNGGGWVANGAVVDPTAYVGPNAAVLGGRVRGAARIEDYAVVWNGTVQDNAIVGGLTQLNANLTVANSARIRSVMAGGQTFDAGSVVNGTAILYGDLETHLGSTPLSRGAFSGYLDQNFAARPEFGANRTAEPVEVTAAVTKDWPSAANRPPVVALSTPAANSSYAQGAVVTVTGTASDADGSVARVELYDNNVLVGSDSTAPYAWTWSAGTAGTHVLSAKAFDNGGASTTSGAVTVTVRAPAGTPPANAIFCARQNATCALPAGRTATVWYGARSSYRVRTGLSGSVPCNNATFGDPLRGTTKACYYLSN